MERRFSKNRRMEISERKYAFEKGETLETMKKEVQEITEKLETIHELGERLLEEKEMLEREVGKVMAYRLPENMKEAIIAGLNRAIIEIQSVYEEKVRKEENHLYEQAQSLYCKLDLGESEAKAEVRELEKLDLGESKADTSEAVREASDAAKQFEIEKRIAADRWELQQEEAMALRQKITTKRLAHR